MVYGLLAGPELDAGLAALHGLGAGQTILHVPSHVPGHLTPGVVEYAGLGAHSVQVYHCVHPRGHAVYGHPLVLTIDSVVEAALLRPHHSQPRANAQAVQVTAVAVSETIKDSIVF